MHYMSFLIWFVVEFIPLNDIIPSDPDAYEFSNNGLLLNLFH